MNTLVIYDNTGYIISKESGSLREPQGGVQFMWIEVPTGKQLTKIDTSVNPHLAILEDIPLSETQLLKQQVDALNIAIANMMGV